MNRKEIKKILPVIQAFAEGKEIQVKGINNWRTSEDLNFGLSPEEYRIKPEPKYRPFNNSAECWKEMHKHPDFGWITDGFYMTTISVKTYTIVPTISSYEISYAKALSEFKFLDGTPFGIKDE